MLGAIIGDIVGSRFEWNNLRKKEFEFLSNKCFFTDDSVMTVAIAKALLDSNKDPLLLGSAVVKYMRLLGMRYPNAGYGLRFTDWIYSPNPKPYNSWGNGSAMRVSACGEVAESLEEAITLSKIGR